MPKDLLKISPEEENTQTTSTAPSSPRGGSPVADLAQTISSESTQTQTAPTTSSEPTQPTQPTQSTQPTQTQTAPAEEANLTTYRVIERVQHNNILYEPGHSIQLNQQQAIPLLEIRAIEQI